MSLLAAAIATALSVTPIAPPAAGVVFRDRDVPVGATGHLHRTCWLGGVQVEQGELPPFLSRPMALDEALVPPRAARVPTLRTAAAPWAMSERERWLMVAP